MGDFLKNQQPAPNPWARRQGYADGLPGFYGLGVIGAMDPCQANTGLDYDIPPYPGEGPGSATIWTEVIDWPFSEDEDGCAFDQANLYGVRTRCIRLPIADGGGDDDYWTAVPKELPAEYTDVGRCGIVELFADHLGDPMAGISWNHRTATGNLLDTSTAEGQARSEWGPRNLNQQVIEGDMVFGTLYDDDGNAFAPLGGICNNHVGFRRIKIVATVLNPGAFGTGYPHTVTRTLNVYCVPVTADPWVYYNDPPPENEALGSFTVSHTFTSGTPSSVDYEFELADMVPSSPGIVQNFAMWADGTGVTSGIEWLIFIQLHFILSPRTDVPLWYFASRANKCAPGGIVEP